LTVLLGRFDITDDSEPNWYNRTILVVHIHPHHRKNATEFKSKADIAILRMASPVEFSSFIQPVCVPDHDTVTTDIEGYVVGHGKSDDWMTEDIAKKSKLTAISAIDCITTHKDHNKGVSRDSFCASSLNSAPCFGDSGGGFYVQNKVTGRYAVSGVVSQLLHKVDCQPGDFSVFVDVPKFGVWIRESEKFKN
jgi:secreted trypsin-like serine protease